MTDTETLVDRVRSFIALPFQDRWGDVETEADDALTELAERLEAAEAEAELKRIETHHANAKRAAAEREVKRQEDEKWAAENRADEAERERDALSPGRWYLRERAETAEAQRDELLEALRYVLPVLQEYSIGADEAGFQTAASRMHEAHEVALTAIAKVEGGGK